VLASDPNVTIQESKAFTCDVRAGRRERHSTERLAGRHRDAHVNTNEDDVPAEEPKEATENR
jgi:formate dehydrogenase major subunit